MYLNLLYLKGFEILAPIKGITYEEERAKTTKDKVKEMRVFLKEYSRMKNIPESQIERSLFMKLRKITKQSKL